MQYSRHGKLLIQEQAGIKEFLEEIPYLLNKNPVTCIKEERVSGPDKLSS